MCMATCSLSASTGLQATMIMVCVLNHVFFSVADTKVAWLLQVMLGILLLLQALTFDCAGLLPPSQF